MPIFRKPDDPRPSSGHAAQTLPGNGSPSLSNDCGGPGIRVRLVHAWKNRFQKLSGRQKWNRVLQSQHRILPWRQVTSVVHWHRKQNNNPDQRCKNWLFMLDTVQLMGVLMPYFFYKTVLPDRDL